MKDKYKNKRKNYFIKKDFQIRFVIKFCTLVILGAVVSGTIIYAMSRSTVTTTFENSRLIMKSTAEFILPAVLLSSTIVVLLLGLATVAITLVASNRVVGPIYRMKKDIQEVASGNLRKKFSLRHRDEGKDLAESLNEMTKALKEDMGKIKQAIAKLESCAETEDRKNKLEQAKSVLSKYTT
ncbi:MAG: methyl-accepting chemotaxis protein [Candidatus Aureabacteria bacterium]|nr:methyl-accepting chemotaxis protein [Candidatus Auribacterota bacterium]MCK5161715.1 methyl-accepting chemotaxis protein [Candidatus Auribacterota bacterium]